MTARRGPAVWLTFALAASAACGGRAPEVRYYRIAPPGEAGPRRGAGPTITVETLEVDAAYDDDRIVYRSGPYRLDYYHYHRWSAPPGELVAGYLERALERTGRFGAVLRQDSPQASAILSGRIAAIEEIDVSPRRWNARIALELRLTDAASGEVLWSGDFEETEPLAEQSPEGLARAVSAALGRITRRLGPEVARAAGRAERRAAAGALDD